MTALPSFPRFITLNLQKKKKKIVGANTVYGAALTNTLSQQSPLCSYSGPILPLQGGHGHVDGDVDRRAQGRRVRVDDVYNTVGRAEHQGRDPDDDQHHIPDGHPHGHIVPVRGELDEHGHDDAQQRETQGADESDERRDRGHGYGQQHCNRKRRANRVQTEWRRKPVPFLCAAFADVIGRRAKGDLKRGTATGGLAREEFRILRRDVQPEPAPNSIYSLLDLDFRNTS